MSLSLCEWHQSNPPGDQCSTKGGNCSSIHGDSGDNDADVADTDHGWTREKVVLHKCMVDEMNFYFVLILGSGRNGDKMVNKVLGMKQQILNLDVGSGKVLTF